MRCPACGKEMDAGYMYVRGLGGSLYWSKSKDTRFVSRRGLDQIDLGRLSLARAAAQAVLNAHRCESCGTVAFKGF